MKQIKSIIIILIMGLILVACSGENNEDAAKPSDGELKNLNDKSEFPIVKDKITLDFFASYDPASNEDWNDVYIFNEYKEKTNIDINWQMVPLDSVGEKLNLALGGGTLPDAFHGSMISSSTLMKYGEQGTFLPLNDLIDEYAPNFKALMEEYPEIEQSITMPDGNIYSFPSIGDPDFLSLRTAPMLYVNEEWLDDLGMDMPETTADFYQYLKAVKEKGPGNGEVDEIPFGAPTMDHLVDNLKGSFGVANKGGNVGLVDEDPKSGDLRFYPISDSYKELLEYLNKLFEEGLIEKNIFSIDHEQFLANSAEGRYGSTVWYSPTNVMGKEVGSRYTGTPALEGPHGDKLYTNLEGIVLNLGNFALTNENENPAATVKWVDYFYGDEGIKFFFMGQEGETYEFNDDDEIEYKDKVFDEDKDIAFSEQVSQYFTFPGGNNPTMIKKDYFNSAESTDISVEAAEKLKDDIIENPWPALNHTKEENNKLDGFGSDIEKYVVEMRDKFISGEESFSKWDHYVEEIKKMNLDEYMDIKNKALERQVGQ